jgi:outer membrane PBP1 activator LpoA protein
VKAETVFRLKKVRPFLKTLKNTTFLAIQQIAISGDPDFLLCMNGLFVALELKSGDYGSNTLQTYKGDEIQRCGGVYLVARPSNWNKIKQQLTALDSKENLHGSKDDVQRIR